MNIKKVTAIIDEIQLDKVEKELGTHGIKGFTIHPVSGRGEYCNTYSRNQLVNHVQIEIYTSESHAGPIARLIMQTADVGVQSEGLVAISSVDELFWVHKQRPVDEDDFKYFEVDHE
jgi:nitrogen regulatory protein PII